MRTVEKQVDLYSNTVVFFLKCTGCCVWPQIDPGRPLEVLLAVAPSHRYLAKMSAPPRFFGEFLIGQHTLKANVPLQMNECLLAGSLDAQLLSSVKFESPRDRCTY